MRRLLVWSCCIVCCRVNRCWKPSIPLRRKTNTDQTDQLSKSLWRFSTQRGMFLTESQCAVYIFVCWPCLARNVYFTCFSYGFWACLCVVKYQPRIHFPSTNTWLMGSVFVTDELIIPRHTFSDSDDANVVPIIFEHRSSFFSSRLLGCNWTLLECWCITASAEWADAVVEEFVWCIIILARKV